jgi:CBS domain-containing protein
MSECVITASPETSIKEACQLMSSHRIHHLPVVALDNTLMGIVSTFDVINWLAD